MKFKYVQTRQVRYVVIIEAPDMNMADDLIHLHEEWQEDRTEECDPPWREDCDPNELPDLYITENGEMISAWAMRQAEMREHPTKPSDKV